MKKKAFAFLEKLAEDDTLPGLHVEPIAHSADPRARTGRVDDFYRAVLFRIPEPRGPPTSSTASGPTTRPSPWPAGPGSASTR